MALHVLNIKYMFLLVGTAWTKELVWLIQHDGDVAAASETPPYMRAKFLELSGFLHPTKLSIDMVLEEPHPRVIHSHLPAKYFGEQLDANVKFVVVIRNPKDALVSFYHFYRSNELLGNFSGSWDDFFEMIKVGHLLYGDYFDWYMDWNKYRKNPNVMFVHFEDMKENLEASVRNLATFLEKALTDETINDVVKYCGFDSMQKDIAGNYSDIKFINAEISPFIRKGSVGDWKNYFSQEQSDFIDTKYEATIQKEGIKLRFE